MDLLKDEIAKTGHFIGSPLDNMFTRAYELNRLSKKANDKNSFYTTIHGKNGVVASGLCYPVEYLANHFNFRIGTLDGLAVRHKEFYATTDLVNSLLEIIKDEFDFLTVNVPSSSINLIKALEGEGFYYAEGLVVMYAGAGGITFKSKPLKIRDVKESDFFDIERIYLESDFPAHLVSDPPTYDRDLAMKLYAQRFREIHEKQLGHVFVAEIDGRFAGAIGAVLDKGLKRETGIITNYRAGQGLVVDPDFRGMEVATQLYKFRDDWYMSQGLEWQIEGANFSNVASLRLLAKIGYRFKSTVITLHKRF